MATMLRWRLDTDVESLVEKGDLINGKEIPKFIEQQKSGKVFSIGCTGAEEPICYVIMKYHSVWGQPASSMQRFIITQMETFRLLMAPPVDKACIFFDLKGFGIKQMDVVSLLYLVKVLESYYPESLAKMYISNAPYIFWGFWRVVKNLLDPVVRNKIVFITGPKETGDHVPETRMIKYCGGVVESEFDFVDPQPGENDIMNDTATKQKLQDRHHRLTDQFEKVTREWCASGGKDEKLDEQRQVLIKKLRLSQFELEPYTRGLTAYHRNGTLPMESPGIATFDYTIGGETTRQIMGKTTCRKSIERELCEISDGSTTVEAEKRTKEMIKDGSWGQWKVNDNSPEIKAKAVATLDDIEGTGKLENVTPAKETTNSSSNNAASATEQNGQQQEQQQSGKKNKEEEEAAAAGAGAGAAGGGAVAAATTATSNGSANNDDTPRKTSNAAPTSNGSAAQTSPSKPRTSPSTPRNRNPGTTDYASEDRHNQPPRKNSLLGKLKSKIAAN